MINVSHRTILFVSHDASRTGAPFMLLHLLRWLKEHTDLSFQILLIRGGALEPDFAAIAPTLVLSREISYGSGAVERLANIVGLQNFVRNHALTRIKKLYEKENVGLVYSNTATNGGTLAWLRALGTPVISHIHELEFWLRHKMDRVSLEQLFENTDYYVVGAEAVRRNLVQNHGVDPRLVETVYEFIPTAQHKKIVQSGVQQRIREQLGIPADAPIIGAAGTTDWRKGVDLFIQLARTVYKQAPDLGVHFVWVGGETKGQQLEELRHDLSNLGLRNVVHFVGAKTNYLEYIASFDVFSLVSREDCFPLVVLEAALFNKPILCFEKGGGAGELVQSDAGFVVPYLDTEVMAERAITLFRNPHLRRTLGERAAEKTKQRHDVAVIAPQIFRIIQRHLSAQTDSLTSPSQP